MLKRLRKHLCGCSPNSAESQATGRNGSGVLPSSPNHKSMEAAAQQGPTVQHSPGCHAEAVGQGVYMESLAHLRKYYDTLLHDDQAGLIAEFNSLSDADMMESFNAAELSNNASKNRYVDVLPYDYNRIRISGDDDYINASQLVCEPGEQPEWCYIATQGPMTSTTSDFWKMVFEKRLPAVIMLTRTIENNHIKCADYYPADAGETSKFGNYRVTTLSVSPTPSGITRREMQVKNHKTQEVHRLVHFHYHMWPDHGVPESVDAILDLSGSLAKDACQNNVVVHCSAGIGRTGAFIALDIILRRVRCLAESGSVASVEQLKAALSVPTAVTNLRKQRRGMVQTLEQYQFIYKALLVALEAQALGSSNTVASH
mmetsp:Transcript_6227/g.13618  ORF Transcript_6227/g.13618 Transcript_6227/m.13618 type:complete len:371 (+) Transcript_6227:193-1305(+)|eukprot:CAMPEP_0202916004 /NCGR_PEP_ID=MMETSP1392-20130828/67383_1 /ASSEMBLY_ACC=CAM_ASM_000868 /TAXON_ID=225041 /ORGANISM="Chlamydomonas chlamydogama, Strain SAG 11-48b" /LENGTH=370 /DNA_ID=CAMNT_0049608245 /DNA_START=169 /DNA_END=1281 /DNA_ORIENTATION=-